MLSEDYFKFAKCGSVWDADLDPPGCGGGCLIPFLAIVACCSIPFFKTLSKESKSSQEEPSAIQQVTTNTKSVERNLAFTSFAKVRF